MTRNLRYNQGIIPGDVVRDTIKVFHNLKEIFEQRKNYDEYYYSREAEVELNLSKLNHLNWLGYIVELTPTDIIIKV